MSTLEELLVFRNKLTETQKSESALRAENDILHQRIQAKDDIINSLRSSLTAQRELQNRTPSLGTKTPETDDYTRKSRHHA